MTIASSPVSEVDAATSFRIYVRYITDRCVAARVDAREQPEWPPHPGRLYMALAAAHFETDSAHEDKAAERRALEWLASRPAPRLHVVDAEERTAVVCYVPVNDAPQPNKAMLQSAPGMPRSRQSRTFPTVIPQRIIGSGWTGADITFEWLDAQPSLEHLPALDRLCRNMIRIGHSSSLVMAWAEAGSSIESGSYWEPAEASTQLTCRIAATGELERLKALCQSERIDLFAALKQDIESTTGKAQKVAKERFAETFGEPYKASIRPPEPTPATLGVWQGYRRVETGTDAERVVVENRYFDRNLIILAKDDGPVLNIERTLGLTNALRKAFIAVHGPAPTPPWLTGHDTDGSPTSSPHAAFLPLPYVGFPHADGHIMGLAIALPKGISVSERARWLGPLLVNQETGESSGVSLGPKKEPKNGVRIWGDGLPDWTMQLEERPSPPRILQNLTWTRPSTTWASVTPVVLDRFPKASRAEDRSVWQAEVIGIIKQACTRGGLPDPIEVDIDSTAWHAGVPRAWAKTRRLHGRPDTQTVPLGDGFPSLEAKPSRPAKPQVHVWLRFANKVSGPVLIGAGRFTGYGLCMPLPGR